MADHRHPANDAWEALLSAHASLIRRFGEQDVWKDVSMKEYDVLYTLSKCDSPIRLTELNRHVLLSQPALSRMVDRLPPPRAPPPRAHPPPAARPSTAGARPARVTPAPSLARCGGNSPPPSSASLQGYVRRSLTPTSVT